MLRFQLSYLIANAALLLVWLLLFLWRKDTHKEMLIISTLFGIAGLASEPIYTIDWWQPLTITGTRVGIEDFLFGFWVGGISAVIYEIVFKKKVRPRKIGTNYKPINLVTLNIVLALLFFGGFFILRLNSFYASIFAFTPLILFIWIKRSDLIINSLFSGLLLSAVGLLWFWVPELITPGWIKTHWLFENLSGVLILKAPLEDLIWGFLAGAFIGPLYEFWQQVKLINIKTPQ